MLKTETLLTVGAMAVVVLAAAYLAKKAGATVQAVADTAGGIVSGNNVVTQAARTDAYQGAGVLGTLGAATDIASGGILSRIGEWIGGKAADLTLPDPLAAIAPATNQRSATSGGAHGFY